MNAVSSLVSAHGGDAAFARSLGRVAGVDLLAASVQQWRQVGQIPSGWLPHVAELIRSAGEDVTVDRLLAFCPPQPIKRRAKLAGLGRPRRRDREDGARGAAVSAATGAAPAPKSEAV